MHVPRICPLCSLHINTSRWGSCPFLNSSCSCKAWRRTLMQSKLAIWIAWSHDDLSCSVGAARYWLTPPSNTEIKKCQSLKHETSVALIFRSIWNCNRNIAAKPPRACSVVIYEWRFRTQPLILLHWHWDGTTTAAFHF